jgi:hypothetical protein
MTDGTTVRMLEEGMWRSDTSQWEELEEKGEDL